MGHKDYRPDQDESLTFIVGSFSPSSSSLHVGSDTLSLLMKQPGDPLDIDQHCDRVVAQVEQMRNCLKNHLTQNGQGSHVETGHHGLQTDTPRERELLEAILRTVIRLEKTKQAFKSRQIKAIREDLLNVLQSRGQGV